MKTQEFTLKHLVAFIVATVVFVIMALNGRESKQPAEPADPNAWMTRDNSVMSYLMMEDYVEARLKSPSTAEFPGILDGFSDHVTATGNQTYRIVSYVDSQNSFGAMIRTRFSGEIKQISEYQWQLVSLELQ